MVGIYGGTFDPPHVGHIEVATSFARCGCVDEVLVVPTAGNPLKGGPSASFEDRVVMTKIAFEGLLSVEVLMIEASEYMIDVVDQLMSSRPGDYGVLVGADALVHLPRWHRAEELLERVGIIAFDRGSLSANAVRSELPSAMRSRVSICPHMRHIALSSTAIRRLGLSASNLLVPLWVIDYCRQMGLYDFGTPLDSAADDPVYCSTSVDNVRENHPTDACDSKREEN